MNFNDITALSSMLSTKPEPEIQSKKEKMTPGSIGATSAFRQQLVPKNIPKAKKFEEIEEAKGDSSSADIWDEDESSGAITFDPRKRPEVEICYFQFVGSEDIFLGMGTKDPGTSSSDGIKIKIILPNEKMSDIEIDIQKEIVNLSTPN